MKYGQFCPVAKTIEIIGEKWTILIIRELLMGGTRFSELQRGLGLISPTILSKRLDSLADFGLILKKKIPGQKGYEYFPTESCQELLPLIYSMGEWGIRWARSYLSEDDYDVELLMLYLQRSIMPEKLAANETVIQFKFLDSKELPDWWIIVIDDNVDICTNDPGKDVDVYFTSTIKTMTDIWMGDRTYKQAKRDGDMNIVGNKQLTSNITDWMGVSYFSDLPPATEI